MPKEKSAGAIIYRMENGVAQYLLLHYTPSSKGKRGQWGFAKGHVEAGETEIQTAKREIAEETGITEPDCKGGDRHCHWDARPDSEGSIL